MIVEVNKHMHQDNLKMEIYHQFKQRFLGYKMKLIAEYRVSGCRFDLLLYDTSTNEVICIVEVRRIGVLKPVKPTSRKQIKYSAYCKTVLFISLFSEINTLLDKFEQLYLDKNY